MTSSRSNKTKQNITKHNTRASFQDDAVEVLERRGRGEVWGKGGEDGMADVASTFRCLTVTYF